MNRFLVVHFLEENSVSVVPSNWVLQVKNKEICFWPAVSSQSRLKKMVKNFEPPTTDWNQMKIKVMSATVNYEKAVRRAKREEFMLNLSSSSSDSDDIQSIPQQAVQDPSSAPVTAAAFEAFGEKVVRLLEEQKADLREIREMVGELRNGIQSTERKLPQECPTLPAEDVNGLFELDKFLGGDPVHFQQVCNYFGTRGGATVNDATRRILHDIMTNTLAKSYNWKGTRGLKLAFMEYVNILNFLKASTRVHFKEASDFEIEGIIKKWLVHASDRDGGRTLRALKRHAAPQGKEEESL